MIDEQLKAIEERAEKATPGPWKAKLGGVLAPSRTIMYQNANLHLAPGDMVFIAHARTDVPALVAEVRRLSNSSYQVTYDNGALSVNGAKIADHSELPQENDRLFKENARLREHLAECERVLEIAVKRGKENARLREALTFYADKSNYIESIYTGCTDGYQRASPISYVACDDGANARAALGKK